MSRDLPIPAIETLFAAEEVSDAVAALGRRIDEELGGEDLLLIALLGGSVIFLAADAFGILPPKSMTESGWLDVPDCAQPEFEPSFSLML